METIKLGATDLEVSRICLGTWQFGGDWGEIDHGEAIATVARARELGVSFFDTAQAYGFGASEQLLAQALEGVPREQVVLATKGGLRKEGNELLRDSSPAWLRKGLEESLRYLGTDYVDLYQVHWPDPGTPFEETAAALEQFVQEGKVRYVGASNFDTLQIAEFAVTRRLDTLQPPYHMLRREIEDALLPYCREHDIGVLAYGPLAHGLLSGSFTRDSQIAQDDWRAGSDLFGGENFERNLADRGAPEGARAGAGDHGRAARDRVDAGESGGPRRDRRSAAPGAHRGGGPGGRRASSTSTRWRASTRSSTRRRWSAGRRQRACRPG